jgi:hypothetical protein
MPESTIHTDPPLAYLAFALASLARRTPDLATLHRAFDIADVALGAVEQTLTREPGDESFRVLAIHAHGAYLAAIALAKTLDCMSSTDAQSCARNARARRTATQMLDVVERVVSPADRALRARILGESCATRLAA